MYTQQSLAAHIAKKHPNNYSITTNENTNCVLGHTVYAFVETEDEKLMYGTDKAGRCRLLSRDQLNPTYKSIRLQPKDSLVRIKGGKYDGHYIIQHTGEGWFKTSLNLADANPMRASYANDFRSYCAFHAQYCYRGEFEVVKIL